MLPPSVIRRAVFTPALFVFTAGILAAFPLLYMITSLAAVADHGRRRTVRLLWFTLGWAVFESVAVLACFPPWLLGRGRRASDGGGLPDGGPGDRYRDRHYQIVGRFVARIHRAAVRHFDLRVVVDEPSLTGEESATLAARPIIVLSRHAGPGDALLLIHHLLNEHGRRPRVVMKARLQLDPFIDITANRLPNLFIGRAGEGQTEDVGRLAHGLGPADAVVIFPEGGKFTPKRRRRAIRRLIRLRHHPEAVRADRIHSVMPPRPGGVLAALDADPAADVIFVAHTGLEDLSTVADVWRHLPMRRPVRARWWRIPAEEVPRNRDAQVDWLYAQWERVDQWAGAPHPPDGLSA